MRAKIWVTSVAIASIGAAAWAHNGATGIVKERMDAMSAMGQVVKDLTPMMRGQIEFDADQVRAAADVMITHTGEQMVSLFPEGTGGMPSSALPSVWEDGEKFAALSEQLQVYAEGLKLSAANGIASAQDGQNTATMGGATDSMMGADTGSAMGGMMGTTEPMSLEMFSEMSADTAFAAIAQTCSACHQTFRAEEN